MASSESAETRTILICCVHRFSGITRWQDHSPAVRARDHNCPVVGHRETEHDRPGMRVIAS